MTEKNTDPVDGLSPAELLRRASQAARDAVDGKSGSDNAADISEQRQSVSDEIEAARGILGNLARFKSVVETIWFTYLKPVSLLLQPLFSRYWRFCKYLFNRAAFDRAGKYHRKRAAGAVIALFLATIFFGYHLIYTAVPLAVRFSYDAVMVNLLSETDAFIFSQPSPVEGEPGILSVYACKTYPCEGQIDSIEFRLRDSVYLDFISFFKYFQPHDPGELAGAFVTEENACSVEFYGKRVKYLGFYPYITKAICLPVSGSTSPEQALEQIRSVAAK